MMTTTCWMVLAAVGTGVEMGAALEGAPGLVLTPAELQLSKLGRRAEKKIKPKARDMGTSWRAHGEEGLSISGRMPN
jgi:hypothetical protein